MREIKAPNPLPANGPRCLFLAGSIEMGAAENWQERVKRLLAETNWVILNPRRDDWDSSWKQTKDFGPFREQVEWELEALELANVILLYFDPPTKSPISLLELGLFARTGKMIVVCPEGFWRRGNVDIVCNRYEVRQAETIESAVAYLVEQYDPDGTAASMAYKKGEK